MTNDVFRTAESNLEGIEAEALAWIAQLDGENISERDLAAFNEWVNRSPAHARMIKDLNGLWGELNILTDMAAPIAKHDRIYQELRAAKSKTQWRKRVLIPTLALSAAIAVVGIGSFQFAQIKNPQTIETAAVQLPSIYKTKVAEFQEYILEDGSKITLNTNSVVEVEYRRDQRRIRLLQGEVLFDVAHDPARPFLVFAGDGIVRAVGTAFSVHLRDGHLDLIVTEGAVELSSVAPETTDQAQKKSVTKIASLGTVKAGQSVVFKKSDPSISINPISEEKMTVELSWKEGMVSFDRETSLPDVIREVSRYTDLEIKILDTELNDVSFGGALIVGDMEGLYEQLRIAHNINVDTSIPGVVSLSKSQ